MVQNNRVETTVVLPAPDASEVLVTPALRPPNPVSPGEGERNGPAVGPIEQAAVLAEAERWLTVIPPTAACYRLLQLGILRRDFSLLEGLLSVLRSA